MLNPNCLILWPLSIWAMVRDPTGMACTNSPLLSVKPFQGAERMVATWLALTLGWSKRSIRTMFGWEIFIAEKGEANENRTQKLKLVGGLEHQFYFPIYWVAFIIPIDGLIFFRGVAQPPTSKKTTWVLVYKYRFSDVCLRMSSARTNSFQPLSHGEFSIRVPEAKEKAAGYPRWVPSGYPQAQATAGPQQWPYEPGLGNSFGHIWSVSDLDVLEHMQ